MPRQAKSKEEIEFVFGFKQVLGVAILVAFVFGGGFFWGLETGHKRALQGQSSLLAFLERAANPEPQPVEIPDVLLNPVQGDRASSTDGANAPNRPASAPSESQPEADQPTESRPSGRVKPEPGIKAKAESPEPSEPAPEAAPVSRPEAAAPARESQRPKPSSRDRLHYQVAALRVRTNAKALVDLLRSEGFKARIAPASDDGLFRVYVGPFRSDTDAATARDRLTKDGFKPMVRNL